MVAIPNPKSKKGATTATEIHNLQELDKLDEESPGK